MFYIYHIPARKEWGCTKNLNRRLRELQYSHNDLDRVITASNIDVASELEKKMNIEYGYGWNSAQDYRRVTSQMSNIKKNRKKSNLIKAGSIGGNTTKNKKLICPHCKKEGQFRAMLRWHGDNCKFRTS